MTLPTYQHVMLPVLQILGANTEMRVQVLIARIEDGFRLSEEDRQQLLPSGRQRTIVNRVQWCVTYMAQAGLIERPGRGVVRITERGREALAMRPEQIDVPFLMRYPEFEAFRQRSTGREGPDQATAAATPASDATPEEVLEATYRAIREATEQELLDRVLAAPPEFFEQLVVDLLIGMGYGGSNTGEAGRRVGRSRRGRAVRHGGIAAAARLPRQFGLHGDGGGTSQALEVRDQVSELARRHPVGELVGHDRGRHR